MCGFVGFFGGKSHNRKEVKSILTKMVKPIHYRGPDDEGFWLDEKSSVYLCHKRLSIIDLSLAGHQPMQSDSGRYVIAFNGEIYNHRDIRGLLESKMANCRWRGNSDTETLLTAFDNFGIVETLKMCVGMFSFAVFDQETKQLTLARDRLGEKPLYYGWIGHGDYASFVFGSDIASLRQHPAFNEKIDRGAIALFMRHSYIPTPYSIFQNVFKLPAGCFCTISLKSRDVIPQTYWSFLDIAHRAAAKKFTGSREEAISKLEEILKCSIKQQMVADVPLGAFLSGGVDSSTVVALMQAQSDRPIKTFSIGFQEGGFNEAGFAKSVASHLGTDHTELYVTPEESLDVIPNLASIYTEPFGDSSQIPTFLVSQLAKQDVKVSLSGDGGDELFCGYNRYLFTNNMWHKINRLPIGLRRSIASSIRAFSPSTLNKIISPLQRLIPASLSHENIGDKLHKGAGILASPDLNKLYLGLISHWSSEPLVLNTLEPSTIFTDNSPKLMGMDPISKMMIMDTMSYLPDDILTKVDRATMAVSLEGRMPFLDHHIVEFAWSLPQSYKLYDGIGKWVLRQVLYRHVPRFIIDRPKMGFGIPIAEWLRGPLREWSESLLDPHKIKYQGYLNSDLIQKKWKEHLSGNRNWGYQLWNVLMFQSWLELNNV